ncbi:hypothetical protein [Streptococcus suis]|uniref:hypothetical protein n=1 Tax=Streptococcus suis TaxID=1307 RepID=UPI003F897531
MIKNIKGKVYNFSLDGKRAVQGWYLIIGDDDREYLVRRNFNLSSNWYRKVYVSKQSLKKHLVNIGDYERISQSSKYQGWGIAIGAIINQIVPSNLFFGDINNTGDVIIGIKSIGTLVLVTAVSFFVTSVIRKMRLERELGSLVLIGKIKSKTALNVLTNGREFW